MNKNPFNYLLVRLAVVLSLAISLPACASKSPSLLIPIENAPENGKIVDLLAITTRAPLDIPDR